MARTTAYRARQRNEAFALAWVEVEDEVTEKLEAKARDSALAGKVRLIEFLLKARRPDVYREHRQVRHVGPVGPVAIDGYLSKLSDCDLAALQRIGGLGTWSPSA